MSANNTCARSRHEAWIVRAQPLAEKVSGDCLKNSRLTMKVWPVVFGCLNFGPIHIELNKTYGTDALLLLITAFTSIRGYPTVFYTDRGTQLCKAGKYIDSKEDPVNWTWGKFEETLVA